MSRSVREGSDEGSCGSECKFSESLYEQTRDERMCVVVVQQSPTD
jgi:hypothetical protein